MSRKPLTDKEKHLKEFVKLTWEVVAGTRNIGKITSGSSKTSAFPPKTLNPRKGKMEV